jgi:hypothetical protein
MKRIPQLSVLVAVLGGVGALGAVLLTVRSLSRKYEPSRITFTAPVDVSSVFLPSGWMGDAVGGESFVRLAEVGGGTSPATGDRREKTLKFDVSVGPQGWAGICWQYPVNNWGERPGASIKGATKLTFWAEGARGGEILEFHIGITNADSAKATLPPTVLQTEWQKYEIELRDQELSNVVTAFAWITPSGKNSKPISFYLRDIRLE